MKFFFFFFECSQIDEIQSESEFKTTFTHSVNFSLNCFTINFRMQKKINLTEEFIKMNNTKKRIITNKKNKK